MNAIPPSLFRAAPPPAPNTDDRAADVERALILAGLDAVASRDFAGALIDVSVSLQAEASKRSKPSHWLCELLADAADAVDPATIARAFGDVFADALVAQGVPDWAAAIAGWGIAKAAEGAISSVAPGSQLCLGLRVLGVLVCPSLASCPVGPRLSVPLFKAALESPSAR